MRNIDVTTGVVRLSYAHLFTPYAGNYGGEAKYSTTILVPKSDIATKQRIDEAINAAITAGIAEKWGGQRPPILPIPVYDGDGPRPSDGMPYGPECQGHWVFTASGKQPPQVVDEAIQPILDQSLLYSGVYARVSVSFYPYNSNGKKGIGCGLNAVQRVADGEPLGGGVSAAEAFGGSNTMAQPAPASPAYPQPTAPAPAYPQPTALAPAYPQPAPPAPAYPQTVQPQYGQAPSYPVAPAPAYPQPAVAPQPAPGAPTIDPITGMPVGGVMGL